jgi:hypothetical protein
MSESRPIYIIAVYDVDRRYGGPEEGGWWYDAGTLVRVVRTMRHEQRAYDYCNRLNRKLRSRVYGPNQGKRELSSVLSDGVYEANVWECTAPAKFPESRPYYC